MTFDGWLSPTSAWRLVQCRAAYPGSAATSAALQPAGKPTDAGSLAHEAMRHWVSSLQWQNDESGNLLRAGFDRAAAEAGVEVATVPRGVLTRARLAGIAGALRSALEGADAVGCEVELSDVQGRLRGRADILVTAPHPAVLDLKTGKMATGQAPEGAMFQLLVYAHLFRAMHGVLPERLEVISLAHGRVAIRFGEEDVAEAIMAVARARAEAGGMPTPQAAVCRSCPRRMACGAFWAQEEAERPDTVEGEVVEVAVAATGALGIRVHGEPDIWVTQLRPHQVPPGLRRGNIVRIIELAPGKPTAVERRASRGARVVKASAGADFPLA